jgi:peptidoglycan/LPS O-acetylase OafA/YrhL
MAAVLGFIGPKVAVMFPVWLMGVAAYCACRRQRLPMAFGWVLFVAPVALLAGYELLPHSGLQQFSELSLDPERLKSLGRDYLVAALFCLHIVGFARISTVFLPWLDRHAGRIRWIAGATFSIYLMHLPIMHVLAAASPWPRASLLRLVLLLLATPAACVLLAEVSERRKVAWRQAIEFGMRSLEPALLARRKAG